MSRRGPRRPERPNSTEPARLTSTSTIAHGNRELLGTTTLFGLNPPLVFLSSNESILLDHYIQRFSRTYPTCQAPTNPFLSVLLPFALQHPIVLDALLAVSGAQHWQSDSMTMEGTTLQLRRRALRGCRALLNQPDMKTYMETEEQIQSRDGPCSIQILPLAACCVLLLLYEKLVGNGKLNWMSHLSFLASFFERLFPGKAGTELDGASKREENQVFQFLYNLFLYNDLVHSTATGTTTLSDYYLTTILSTHLPQSDSITNRYYYPCLIAQIAADNVTVTDTDIDAWDGRLDWLPSFSSTCHTFPGLDFPNGTDEWGHAIQLYQYTAKIFLRQSIRRQRDGYMQVQDADTSILAERAVACLSTLPEGSSFENALLWPISICARELTHGQRIQRKVIMQRLQQLEGRFHMRHFRRMQEVLEAAWARFDEQSVQKASWMEEDAFLLG